ncbi:MAG TPA: twin-arginine translocase subunit TatC [Chloroflexota bacterium]|jgi:sec-independent protein translocase protein TatC|nr:twin-arginine translocase subunit TatC [Chloroflexota bacterium]
MTLTESPPPAPAPTPGPDHAPGDREMTMLEHLEELRQRLVVSVVAVVGGILVSIVPVPGFDSITHFVVSLLAARAPAGRLLVLGPGEGFFTFLEVSLLIGAALAMPVIIYQVLAFVSPALYESEKKYLLIAVPGVSLSFACGVLFCYYVMLPFAIAFLGGFATDVFNAQWSAERYLDFVTTFLFWVGLTFELPIVMYFLTKMGVVSPQRLARFRKYAFVLAFVAGAIITPTPDPINQTIVSLPIYFLFELGVILARFA